MTHSSIKRTYVLKDVTIIFIYQIMADIYYLLFFSLKTNNCILNVFSIGIRLCNFSNYLQLVLKSHLQLYHFSSLDQVTCFTDN